VNREKVTIEVNYAEKKEEKKRGEKEKEKQEKKRRPKRAVRDESTTGGKICARLD